MTKNHAPTHALNPQTQTLNPKPQTPERLCLKSAGKLGPPRGILAQITPKPEVARKLAERPERHHTGRVTEQEEPVIRRVA